MNLEGFFEKDYKVEISKINGFKVFDCPICKYHNAQVTIDDYSCNESDYPKSYYSGQGPPFRCYECDSVFKIVYHPYYFYTDMTIKVMEVREGVLEKIKIQREINSLKYKLNKTPLGKVIRHPPMSPIFPNY